MENRMHAAVGALMVALSMVACGGGGDTADSGGGTADIPPVTAVQAVAAQNALASDVRALFEELAIEENIAHDALDNQDYATWNAYWREDYPAWVDRLSALAEDYADADEAVRAAVRADERKQLLEVGIIAAITITGIAIKERERWASMNANSSEAERDAAVDRRADYLRREQGLNETQARTRAIADIGQLETLRSLRTGIEHARDFVLEQVPNFLTGYLPERIGNLVDLADTGGKLNDLRDNVETLFSSQGCSDSDNRKPGVAKQGGDFDDDFVDNFPVCRVVFCDGSDLRCEGVPADDYDAAVFAPGLVRDEVPTMVVDGADNGVDVTLRDADEFDEPGDDQGGADDDAAFEIISYRNFDGTFGTGAAGSDVQIITDAAFPTFSWNRDNTIQIFVDLAEDEGSSAALDYGIFAIEDDMGTATSEDDEQLFLPSTIRYGDYDVVNSQPLGSARIPSPELIIGETYALSVAIEVREGEGEAAGLVFRRRR